MTKSLEYVGIFDTRYVCIIDGELYVSDPMEEQIMWKTIKNILAKKACFHEWKLVKENQIGGHYHYIYICQKCGDIKVIEIN